MGTTTSFKLDDEQKQALQELADAQASAREHDQGGGGMTIAQDRKHLKKPERNRAR